MGEREKEGFHYKISSRFEPFDPQMEKWNGFFLFALISLFPFFVRLCCIKSRG